MREPVWACLTLMIGCGGATPHQTEALDEDVRAAALAAASVGSCPSMVVEPVLELPECVERDEREVDAPHIIGDERPCLRWAKRPVPPNRLWMARGCGLELEVGCGICGGAMTMCSLDPWTINCPTAFVSPRDSPLRHTRATWPRGAAASESRPNEPEARPEQRFELA
jgi:hypothetical protein